jgi:hypothetical protein
MSRRHNYRSSSSSGITPGKVLRATAQSIASDLNPFGPNRDPAKDLIPHPENIQSHRAYYQTHLSPLSPVESITMDDCVKYPHPENKRAIKYKPSQCIKIMNHINKNKKTGICPGKSKEKCIMDAAKHFKIENPNEYGDPNDLLMQIEGYEREQAKNKQNESARARSKATKEKTTLSKIKKTFKKLSAISESRKEYKAGRHTRSHRRKNRK